MTTPANIRNVRDYGAEPSSISAATRSTCHAWCSAASRPGRGIPPTGSGHGGGRADQRDPRLVGRHRDVICSTRTETDQRVDIYGTTGRISIEIPFNIPPDRPTRVFLTAGGDPPVAPDRQVVESDRRSVRRRIRTVRDGRARRRPHAGPPEDAVANLRVIDSIFGSRPRNGRGLVVDLAAPISCAPAAPSTRSSIRSRGRRIDVGSASRPCRSRGSRDMLSRSKAMTTRALALRRDELSAGPAEHPRPAAARGGGHHHGARSWAVGLHFEVSVPQILAAIVTCADPRGRVDIPPESRVRLAGQRDADGQRRRPHPARRRDARR